MERPSVCVPRLVSAVDVLLAENKAEEVLDARVVPAEVLNAFRSWAADRPSRASSLRESSR